MTVLEEYKEIQKRIKSVDNQEKYKHLYLSENLSPNEKDLLFALKELELCVRPLNNDDSLEKEKRQLFINSANLFLKRIKRCLEIDNWN